MEKSNAYYQAKIHRVLPILENLVKCRCGERFAKTARNYRFDFPKFLKVHADHGGVGTPPWETHKETQGVGA